MLLSAFFPSRSHKLMLFPSTEGAYETWNTCVSISFLTLKSENNKRKNKMKKEKSIFVCFNFIYLFWISMILKCDDSNHRRKKKWKNGLRIIDKESNFFFYELISINKTWLINGFWLFVAFVLHFIRLKNYYCSDSLLYLSLWTNTCALSLNTAGNKCINWRVTLVSISLSYQQMSCWITLFPKLIEKGRLGWILCNQTYNWLKHPTSS